MWIKLSFQKATYLTFYLANQLVPFKLANEKSAQSLSASKVDMCSGHKLISLGLKKQGWSYYCRYSGQDNYIHRKTSYYCQLCDADKPLCLPTTSCDCFELHLFGCMLSPKYCIKENRIFSTEVWYIKIYFSYAILML